MNAYRKEFATAAILILSSFLLVNPLGLFMPSTVHMTVLVVLVAATGAFAAFMLRERAVDERDDANRMHAGHAAFFVGTAVLLLGIVSQTLAHTLDPWLVWALSGMVGAKVVARAWSESNR